jgi:predicted Zn finger-like uncharacterized protein
MIVTCPACAVRYRVADQEFADVGGRTVRCANCGHSWYETRFSQQERADPEPAREAMVAATAGGATPELPAAPRPIERMDAPPRLQSAMPRATPASLPKAGGGQGAARVVIVLFALAAIAVAGVFIVRRVAAVWPSASPLYASTGQSPAPSGTGLIIRKILPSRTGDGLIIDGEIANPGSTVREIPRLRVALQDSAGKEVGSETIAPPEPRLQPGEVAHFETPFAHPPDTAIGVVVTFASS